MRTILFYFCLFKGLFRALLIKTLLIRLVCSVCVGLAEEQLATLFKNIFAVCCYRKAINNGAVGGGVGQSLLFE